MNYYLYKLHFSASVHFGAEDSARSCDSACMTFRADTLFSALCYTLAVSGRESEIGVLAELCQNGALAFSDAMPYRGQSYYLPRPIMPASPRADTDPSRRKEMKKLDYLPLSMWNEYLRFLRGEDSFPAGQVGKDAVFGAYDLVEKVSLDTTDKAEPYSVGLFSFHEDSGLYGLIGYEDAETLLRCRKLLELLGVGGIGGKRSAGYGAFTLNADEGVFLNAPVDKASERFAKLLGGTAPQYMLLSTAFPCDADVEAAAQGTYRLVRRSGFSASPGLEDSFKKQTQYFFAPGSVFSAPFHGMVYKLSCEAPHPVYRYAQPIFLGVAEA